jgi:hypothetical protein
LIRRETVYFEEGGAEHTDVTLDLVYQATEELGIKKVVVASTSGDTGVKAAEKFSGTGVKVIVVGHQTGFPVPGKNQFKPENVEKIEALGAEVNLGSDVLTNSIRQRQRLGHSPLSLITQALITMKVKVNVEIVAKAADAGQLAPGELCISVAGSHWGADTAVVFEAQDSSDVLGIRPREVIAMPLSRKKADEEYMKRRQASQGK